MNSFYSPADVRGIILERKSSSMAKKNSWVTALDTVDQVQVARLKFVLTDAKNVLKIIEIFSDKSVLPPHEATHPSDKQRTNHKEDHRG